MKKNILLASFILALVSCTKTKTTETVKIETKTDTVIETSTKNVFNLDEIQVSTADLGVFPFFTLPEGATYLNKVKEKAFDFIVFVTPDDAYEVEGKTYRAWISQDKNSATEISNRYILSSYEDAILKAGGVKVFEGKLTGELLNKYETLATYSGSDGSIDVRNEAIVSYVIKRTDGNVYITLEKKNFAASAIQIVQEKPLTQTIKKVTSTEIASDLASKGKSVLYINFDTNKADLSAEGKILVDEISKALTEDTSLKISIEGHTDTTGDAGANKKLSNDRANAVLNTLVKAGIDKARLKAVGYGAEKPLVANDSELNKAKNRRVELVKF